MKILAIADKESPYLWDYYEAGRLSDIDLILSAGDLSSDYLSFLVTMSQAPLFYIHGNHDGAYHRKPPEGCVCIEDKIVTYQGLRIMGLGGSMNYNNGLHQYTEKEMRHRLMKLTFPILYHKGIDILLTHAPVAGFHDSRDLPHQGFHVFERIIDKLHPAYHIHGHVHREYGHQFTQIDKLHETTVVNAYEKIILDL